MKDTDTDTDPRRELAWDLASAAAVLLIGVGLWGIADTGAFEGTPLAFFGNVWLALGLAFVVGGLIMAPRSWLRKDNDTEEKK